MRVSVGDPAEDRMIFEQQIIPAEVNAHREDQQNALKLSDNEKDIIMEANKAIQMLEEEGSGVAFPEVFQQVREDMKHVQRRLEIADVAEVTQAVEKDIIASLQEMIEALKKQQQQGRVARCPRFYSLLNNKLVVELLIGFILCINSSALYSSSAAVQIGYRSGAPEVKLTKIHSNPPIRRFNPNPHQI